MRQNRYRRLAQLGEDAKPRNDDDWGTERQIDALNLFFDEVARFVTEDVFHALEQFCLKATVEERVKAGLDAARGFSFKRVGTKVAPTKVFNDFPAVRPE